MRAVHCLTVRMLAIVCLGLSCPLSAAQTTLILPNSFRAYLLDASGSQELVPDWTERARRHLHAAMIDEIARNPQFEPVVMPELSTAQLAILDEHIALFEANANAAIEMRALGSAAAGQPRARYSVGPGLAFLAAAGVDRLVVISGSQTWSTGGRLLSRVFAGGAKKRLAPSGVSGLLVGYIVTASGDIEWMNIVQPVRGGDVRDAAGAIDALAALTAPHPDGLFHVTNH